MTYDPSRQREKLAALAGVYFELERGTFIEHPAQTHKISMIEGEYSEKHPQQGHEVFITRKALKHFVESRKEEMRKHHIESEILANITFAVEHIQDVIVNFDLYELEPPDKHFYSRNYASLGKPNLRVLVEVKNGCLEIVSIHFRKHGKHKPVGRTKTPPAGGVFM